MKKVVLTILFVLGLQNSIFAATQLPIIGHWEYIPAEQSQTSHLASPEGYAFKNDLDGTYLTGSESVGQDYFINEPGTNIYHKYVIHGKKAYFNGKMKYPDGHYEMFSKGVGLDGVTFHAGYRNLGTFMGIDLGTQYSDSVPDLSNAYPASWTLETLPADAIYITLPEGISNDSPLRICKYGSGSSHSGGYSSSVEQYGPGVGLK